MVAVSTLSPRMPAVAAHGLLLGCLLLAALAHVLPAFLAGLLAFSLTRRLLSRFSQVLPRLTRGRHELISAGVVSLSSLVVVVLGLHWLVQALQGETLSGLMDTVIGVLEQFRSYLPVSIAQSIPESVLELREQVVVALKTHAGSLASMGTHALHLMVLVVVGWLVGILAAVHRREDAAQAPLFARTWFSAWRRMGKSFEAVAFAHIKISAVNATLTGIFLLLVMPVLGWSMPYAKLLVLATFLTGLVPVLGNLVSNTLICAVALSVAPLAAVASLSFLVIVHKLEYFLNARIVGVEIGTRAWELLIVLFAAELLFGVAGMVASPIFYAYAKTSLREAGWLQ